MECAHVDRVTIEFYSLDLDKRNTNKEIVLHKKLQPFLYICILALVLQIYPNFLFIMMIKDVSRNCLS